MLATGSLASSSCKRTGEIAVAYDDARQADPSTTTTGTATIRASVVTHNPIPSDLFPVAETLQTMRFAEVAGGDIKLTDTGLEFTNAPLDERKRIFARQLLAYVPLAAHIRRVLDERQARTARKSRFFDELEDYMTDEAAEQTLRAIISWGRYAEVFAYDDENAVFSLENPT